MTVPIGGVLRLTGRMLWQNSVVMIGTHYCVLSGSAEEDADAVLATTGWMDAMYTEIQPVLTNDMDFVDIIVDQVLVSQRHLDTVPWPSLTGGGSSSEPLPSGVAALVSFSTSTLKRRGRKYIGGLTESLVTGGTLSSSFMTDLAAFAGEATNPFAGMALGAIWTPVIFSVIGNTYTTISAAVVRSVPAYQRRRRPGTGI